MRLNIKLFLLVALKTHQQKTGRIVQRHVSPRFGRLYLTVVRNTTFHVRAERLLRIVCNTNQQVSIPVYHSFQILRCRFELREKQAYEVHVWLTGLLVLFVPDGRQTEAKGQTILALAVKIRLQNVWFWLTSSTWQDRAGILECFPSQVHRRLALCPIGWAMLKHVVEESRSARVNRGKISRIFIMFLS